MAPLSDHVLITITVDSLGVRRAGFGVPLILSANASFPERARSYSSVAEVAEDFADSDSPERIAAALLFGQQPHPPQIKIGRSSNKPTQRYALSVATVRNSHTYQIQVSGHGVTPELVAYTSDASATDGEIVAGLVAALNLVTGANYTAAGTSSPFTVTGDAPGDWFSLEVINPSDLLIEQNHADPGVVSDIAAIQLEDDEWYALYTLYNSRAYVNAAAAHVQTQKKIYLADSSTTKSVTLAIGSRDDLLGDLFDSGWSRVAGSWHASPAAMPGVAWLGRVLPTEPGSATWKFKQVTGVTPSTLTTTQRNNLRARKANWYERVAGVAIFSEGTTADGDFIDVTRNTDFLEDEMSKNVYEILASNDIVPYSDEGIAVVENGMRGTLQICVDKGILRSSPAPDVEVPKMSEISDANIAGRVLPDMKFSGKIRGAVHKVNITGVLSV